MESNLPDIATAVESIRRGRVTPRQLVEHCLGQIDRWEDCIRAWAHLDRQRALAEADRLGELASRDHLLGALHGIPIGVKDIIDVSGMATEAGSPLLKGRVATEDAPVVARLRAAGAIILGKTVTTEFACFDPSPTRNPWNPEHTPGGSSSGSAAAVALEMCAAAIGSQTGGSIIRPAAYCGVGGFKPTFGRLDTDGVVLVSPRLDHVGPLARTAADLWTTFAVMAGLDASDRPLPELPEPPTLAVIDDFFLQGADAAVRGVLTAAIDALAQAGATLRGFRLPESFGLALSMHACLMTVDATEAHLQTFLAHRAAYGPRMQMLIDEGLTTLAVDYALALRHQERFRRDLAACFGDDPVIAVAPATPTAAPRGLDSTGDPRFNSPWSLAGTPAVTIPCGLTADGLPCGLQLIARHGQDQRLLSVAAWCERALAFAARVPAPGATPLDPATSRAEP